MNTRHRQLGSVGTVGRVLLGVAVFAVAALSGLMPAGGVGVPTLVLSAPASATAGVGLDVAAVVSQDAAPIADAVVVFTGSLQGQPDVSVSSSTDVTGTAKATLAFPVRGDWSVIASYQDPQSQPFTSDPVVVSVLGQGAVVALTSPPSVVSEAPFQLKATVTSSLDGTPIVGAHVDLSRRASSAATFTVVGQGVTDGQGVFILTTTLWKTASIKASTLSTDVLDAATTASQVITVKPRYRPVAFPVGAVLPKPTFTDAPAAVGAGANAITATIPNVIWASMQGLSWHSGCMARSSLRYVTVNYVGFDGYRYRGSIIVASRAAKAAAAAFTKLYNLAYPIRSMFLVDRYGKAPRGYPGANDYASMAADNTSGFNCRYVVGRENARAMSPHAFGIAIDINTWENPYYSARGPYPNSWWLPRTRKSVVVLTSRSPAVQAFRSVGFSWGGSYMDYQHFQS